MKLFALALSALLFSGCADANQSFPYVPKISTVVSFECVDGILVLDVVQSIDGEEAATLHQIAQYPDGKIVQCVEPTKNIPQTSLQSQPRMV